MEQGKSSKIRSNLSLNSETNIDRSIQGQLFNESVIQCLKGDEDFLNQSCFQELIYQQNVEQEQLQSPTNDEFKQKGQQKQKINDDNYKKLQEEKKEGQIFNFETGNSILTSNQTNMNYKVVAEEENKEIAQLDNNQQIMQLNNNIDIKNDQTFQIDNNTSQSNNIFAKKEKQQSQKTLRMIDQKSNKMITIPDQSIIQISQQRNNMGKKSIANAEKASYIINNVINKQMKQINRINKHVKQFVNYLLLRMKSRNMPALEDNQFKLLDDISYYHRKKINRKLVNNILIFYYYLTKLKIPLPVFMPTQAFRVYWDVFLVIFTYIFLFIYSILIFFYQDYQNIESTDLYFQIAFSIFLFDFLLNLNTAFFNKDVVETNRKRIMLKYLSSHIFFTDAICLFVIGSTVIMNYNLIFNPNNSFATFSFNGLIFLKLNGISSKRNRFSYVFILKEHQKHILKLLNQLLGVITIAHIACIAWYCLGLYEHNNGYSNTWLDKYEFMERNQIEKYIYSLYWSITTMTTVGYGDIAASNYIEALFILICMILFSCVFAYSINNIGFILQEIEKSSKELNENITTIQRYLNRKNVNMSLQSRVRHYLQFLTEEQKDRDQNAEYNIFKTLSNKLRDEITIEVNTKILKNYSIFNANFSHQTIRKLLFAMQEVLISPNEIIFEEGDHEDQSIYFIESGLIEIYQISTQNQGGSSNCKSKIHLIKQLTKNQVFGEISFFSGLARSACARSVNLSTLYKLDKQKFLEIIKLNQEDFERFKVLEEQIKVQYDLSSIYLQCYSCNTQGHMAKNCPVLHQKFDTQFINLKANFSIFQERSGNQQRKLTRRKYNPRLNLQQIKNICLNLKERLQNYNSYVQIMMQSEFEIMSNISENKKKYKQEYQSTFQSQQSSLQLIGSKQEVQLDSNQQKIEMHISLQNDKIKNSKVVSKINSKIMKSQKRLSSQTNANEENKQDLSQREIQNIEDHDLTKLEIQNSSQKIQKANKLGQKTPKSQKKLSFANNEDNKQDYSLKEIENVENTNSELSINKNPLNLNNLSYINNQIVQQEDHKENKSTSLLENQFDKQYRQSIEKSQKQHQEELFNKIVNSEQNENKQKSVNCKFQDYPNRDLSSQIQLEKIDDKQKTKNKNIPIHIKFQGHNNIDQINHNNMIYEDQLKSQLQEQNINTEKRGSNIEFLHSTNKLDEQIQQTPNESIQSLEENDQQFQNQKRQNSQNTSLFKKVNSNINSQNIQLLPQLINNFGSKNNLQIDSMQQIELIDKISKFLNKQRDSFLDAKQAINLNENLYQKNLIQVTDYFDRIKNYKKFFPHNNFDSIFLNHKQKRNKKCKSNKTIGQKGKRQQNFSTNNYHNESSNSKRLIQGINYEQYKPTFYSYGVPQLSDSIYPKYFEIKMDITQSKQQD